MKHSVFLLFWYFQVCRIAAISNFQTQHFHLHGTIVSFTAVFILRVFHSDIISFRRELRRYFSPSTLCRRPRQRHFHHDAKLMQCREFYGVQFFTQFCTATILCSDLDGNISQCQCTQCNNCKTQLPSVCRRSRQK